MSTSSRHDPPLLHDPASRFLPWMMAFLVYIACLALVAAFALDRAADVWRGGLTGAVTIEVPPGPDDDAERLAARLEAARAAALAAPGVDRAEILPEEAVAALLEPWLGSALDIAALPVPRLIDVRLNPRGGADLEALARLVDAAAPGARVDDHALWRDRLIRAMRGIQAIGFAVVGLLLTAAVILVVFATRGGLAAQREVVELLHLIGATDGYIARHFQRHALRNAALGGCVGAAFGAASVLGLGWMAGEMQVAPAGAGLVGWPAWAALAATPAAASFLAWWAARRTVMKTLARIL